MKHFPKRPADNGFDDRILLGRLGFRPLLELDDDCGLSSFDILASEDEINPLRSQRYLVFDGDGVEAFGPILPIYTLWALKENLDPKGTLNPGRFVGRL